MRKILFVFLILTMFIVPVIAQDNDNCSAEAITQSVDVLLADYQEERPTEDDTEVIESVSELTDELLNLVADCMVDNETAMEEDIEMVDDGLPTEGLWFVEWDLSNVPQCPDSTSIAQSDRAVIIVVDEGNKTITLDDATIWQSFEFMVNTDGIYQFRFGSLTFITFYFLDEIASDRINGHVRVEIPRRECILEAPFTLTLLDENILCLAAPAASVNLRYGAGRDFDSVGQMTMTETFGIIGQSVDNEGIMWWQLDNEYWIEQDAVVTGGYCDDVPVVEASD